MLLFSQVPSVSLKMCQCFEMGDTLKSGKCPVEGLNCSVPPSTISDQDNHTYSILICDFGMQTGYQDMIITQQSSTNLSPFRDNKHQLFQFSTSGQVCCGIMAELTQVWDRGVNSLPAQLKSIN